MKKVISQLFLLVSVLTFSTLTWAQQHVELPTVRLFDEELKTYHIESSGVPECDNYFSQLDVCMKKLLSNSEYEVFVSGLNEAKLAASSGMDDVDTVVRSCQDALNIAKQQYSSQGCAFY